MDIAFHIDPLEQLKAYKDSSVAMMRAAAARGHRVFAIEPGHVFSRAGRVQAVSRELTIAIAHDSRDHTTNWYGAGEPSTRALSEFSAVIERKDPPFNMEYVYHTYLFERAVDQGAHVFNSPRAIRDNNEKMAILKHADMIAPTVVTRSAAILREFVAEHRDAIFKPLDGMGGSGIFRVRENDANLGVIIETLTALGTQSIMAQRYLPEIIDGDKRILLIGGQVVPFALARIPMIGETRGNMAAGGKPVVREFSESDRRIAETMAKRLWAEGLFLVGLDVIGERVTEINVTSPTGFVEIEKQTGFNVAELFVQRLEQILQSQ
ncbi:MAG: glutathione synthase [Betaproteobacteria bacterium]|nr:MAG: glutathione synthase [Betaproteobacteria bacterium]